MVSETPNQISEVEKAVSEGGAYELIRKRLEEQADSLDSHARQLNDDRLKEFGDSSMGVIGRIRVRTENNCIARDIIQINQHLLFGYNVYIGLKNETSINDVFGLYKLNSSDDGYSVESVNLQGTFLDDPVFKREFGELYSYYKQTHLLRLRKTPGRLLAFFQIGEKLDDIRVFRWSVDHSGEIKYIDDRGERELPEIPRYDFEWIETSRNDHVSGRHPHVSILDEIFVETIGGSLTIKVENNTEDGLGIYQEAVEDSNQSLTDSSIGYAKLGSLILLRVLPYGEKHRRYFVFNKINSQVNRIDALDDACIQLPEDHGIIYPGGYYLQSGETKFFGDDARGMSFERVIRSPNGEDVLYVFHESVEGKVGLFNYNLIRKELQTPLYGHGFSLFDDGRAILFSAETEEPSRNHPMQIWETPFSSEDHASKVPQSQTFHGKIGNKELVRAISELYSLVRAIRGKSASAQLYEGVIKQCEQLFDTYYWLEEGPVNAIAAVVKEIRKTADLVLDEFEKVVSIRANANEALREAELEQKRLFSEITKSQWQSPEDFIAVLNQLRHQRGHLVTIRELRYIDLPRIDEIDNQLSSEQKKISQKTIRFLNADNAFDSYSQRINEIQDSITEIETVADLKPVLEKLEAMSAGLDLLTEMLGTLKVDDATVRTAILESISEVYAILNQTRAHAKKHLKSLGSEEAVAEFGAQFTLFSQSITNALGLATTPDSCDEQLTRLLAQLEELESQFSEHEEFLADILTKREEVYETFESHKQALLDEQQRRIQNIANAANRILEGISRRTERFISQDEINTYFASDAMVSKCRELASQLRELGDTVRADDIDSRLKYAKDQSIRGQRDKQDIFEDDGSVIKLGKHRFSVNTRPVDLTIVPKDDALSLHLTGTDYFEPIEDQRLKTLESYWDQPLVSESDKVYRAEYLVASILKAAEIGEEIAGIDALENASESDVELLKLVKKFIASRYQEGYEKGIHDHDAVLVLKSVISIRKQAGLLRYPPKVRSLAMLFWNSHIMGGTSEEQVMWHIRSQSAHLLSNTFNSRGAFDAICAEITPIMQGYFKQQDMHTSDQECQLAAEYLTHELTEHEIKFKCSQYAESLLMGLDKHLKKINHSSSYEKTLANLGGSLKKQWLMAQSWLEGYVSYSQIDNIERYIPEVIAMMLTKHNLKFDIRHVDLQQKIEGLMGEHPLVQEGAMVVALDEFTSRLHDHNTKIVGEYQEFIELRQSIVDVEREKLKLEDFKARPLSSFVRNKLISDVYLPILGDNLAKQMGTVGKDKRTDLMGLLLLISPPGYGKTTLMEYVANRMGLIFMKINCPSLGHDVQSLDPQQAPNATARQELEKLNFGLEMGNNVMLYLDDIQHTHPEFLQKFISLCDGSRRIEGVWKGQSKTYDLRGKKFCVVMAGNPYTESGETFKIPDMLANRADIYNLGDVLSGREKQFSMSYIENSLTSNSVLAPLATRDMNDVYKFIRMAEGENVANTDLDHSYSGAEVNEIVGVLKKMFKIQDVVLKVNQQYIASAAQDDKYRTEPTFKLQGSYRNMNKMAEKVSSIMNDAELNDLIRDHYIGEAQTLTTGAEENLLKLGELNGSLDENELHRWKKIKQDFERIQSMGGEDSDSVTKLANQVAKISSHLSSIEGVLSDNNEKSKPLDILTQEIRNMSDLLGQANMHVEVVNKPVPGMDKVLNAMGDAITTSLLPVVSAMEHKLRLDHDIWERVKELGEDIKSLEKSIESKTRKKVDVVKKRTSIKASKDK